MTIPTDSFSLIPFLHENIIPIFFLVLGASSIAWMIGFNVFLTKAVVLRFFRSLSVSTPRARRAFTELKRKSFHLMGLLIPFIYWLGLHYSNGLLTKFRGVVLLGAVTAFIWTTELLRYISPSFRGHYNRLFSSILRKQELTLTVDDALVQEGTLAHSVDQLVQSITTPILGELPQSPRHQQQENSGPHLRSATAAVASATLKNVTVAVPAVVVVSEKIFTGTGFFFLGNWLAMVLFEPTIATCAMCQSDESLLRSQVEEANFAIPMISCLCVGILMIVLVFLVLGDMTAAIVGISFGSIKIGKKSLEGTVGMFTLCFLIGSIFFFHLPGSLPVVFLAALSATLVELFGPADKWWADDNLTIPLATGLAFTLLFQLTHGGVPAA